MDKTFRIATKDNQEKILAVLGGEDSAGAGGLVDQIKKALESMGPSDGMVRYQQPTNLLEFYALPKGHGIATAWRDPVDQLFYDRYGLADSAWEKTVVVANQAHFPENPDDGVKMTNTQRNLYQVDDGDDVTRGNWYFWDLDPTKKTYFRFFTYGTGGVCNSNLKNAYTYDPDVRGAVIFGASKERLMEFFGMSAGFGLAVRLGLGLKDEIVEGAQVAEMDDVATYPAFLARKDLLNAATKASNALERSAYWSKDFDTVVAFYAAGPKWIDGKTLTTVIEDADIVSASGKRVGPAVAASETAMRAVAASDTAMRAVAASDTAMRAVAASDTAMRAVAASDTAMRAVAASDTAMRAVAASDTAMRAVAASDTAMRAVAASDTAMRAVMVYGTQSSLGSMVTALATPARAQAAYAAVSKSRLFKKVRDFRKEDTVSRSDYTSASSKNAAIFAAMGAFSSRSSSYTNMSSCGVTVSSNAPNASGVDASTFAGKVTVVGFRDAKFSEVDDGCASTEVWEVIE